MGAVDGLSLVRQCALAGVSRSSLYYSPAGESAENLALMREIDEMHLKYPFYGVRQVRSHLRLGGVVVGVNGVRRLMRLMGSGAVQPPPRTSSPTPGHRVYPYLLGGVGVVEPDQAWCADITYIPVMSGFFFLAAVMDWATRRVLSSGARMSMDGRGRFMDNIFIERLWRSLKYEAVYLHELEDGHHARRVVGFWIDFYNHASPHSSLHGRTPASVYLGRWPGLAGGVGNLVGGSQSSRFAAPPLRSAPSGDRLPPTTSLLAMAGRKLPAMPDTTHNESVSADAEGLAADSCRA